jgi:hypothetical protein
MAEWLLGIRTGQRYCCKCCGYLTLQTRDGQHTPYDDYQICEVCWWEADLDEDPYEVSGPNHVSLNQGRLLFMSHGATSDHIAIYVRPPRADEIPVRPAPKPRMATEQLHADVAQQGRERQEWREWEERRRRHGLLRHYYRRTLEAESPTVYEEWLALFEYHDPLQIATSRWGLTYDAQVRWMLPFKAKLTDAAQVRGAVHAELLRWFKPEIVGDEERYQNLTQDLWDSLQRYGAPDGAA